MNTDVSVHPNMAALASAVATRLIDRLAQVQAERGEATVVLTGGSVGTATLRAVAALAKPGTSPVDAARTAGEGPGPEGAGPQESGPEESDTGRSGAVNWAAVNFWWGDERFLPAGHADRNAVQAFDALLNHLPVDPNRIHVMGDATSFADVDASAADYAERLSEAAGQDTAGSGTTEPGFAGQPLPRFDVLLLGVGPDAHIASLFPELGGIRTTGRNTVGVTDSPKPPPERVSLTLEAINTADEVWLAVAGTDKAGAVGLALAGANPVQVPAAGASGRRATHWLLDRDAAAEVPQALFNQ